MPSKKSVRTATARGNDCNDQCAGVVGEKEAGNPNIYIFLLEYQKFDLDMVAGCFVYLHFVNLVKWKKQSDC